jgi:hypothetical protein
MPGHDPNVGCGTCAGQRFSSPESPGGKLRKEQESCGIPSGMCDYE